MKTSKFGIDLIKKYEGFAEQEYICPAGKITIGYGHVILPSEHFTKLTKEEATELLAKDLVSRENELNKLVKISLLQNQFDALMSLIYNIGIGNFKTSTLLKYINSNKLNEVPEQFRKWVYSNKVKLKGLVERRESEIKMWLGKL